ncbi:dihydrolipoyllysine-residue succinyltransferase [candidate division KSB3 bacterium]|uniref:Dihydrolipoyllysine-residue succinyltransferase component of 2-oxoglutarate dehydrogenase complex n=1 Tax=candidate division KSB3 bacterium TaxID=2044937 RepID=A0A2G6KDE8_9BACT|nr:MAG: dihydrolipoyllysine-residue succinyltransferase [candidate division KSB3 bacterium]
MKIDVVVPEVGESITNGILTVWLKADGELVEEGEDLFELETEKTTLVVPSPGSGSLKILIPANEEIQIGQSIAEIDPEAASQTVSEQELAPPTNAQKTAPPAAEQTLSPAVRRVVEEHNLEASALQATGPKGNITKEDALRAVEQARQGQKPELKSPSAPGPIMQEPPSAPVAQTRVKMTPIRKKIAENLVQSQQTAAHLTTFHEVDMSAIIALRSQYKEEFQERAGVRLGFMSFFVKAAQQALAAFPGLNAFIEGEEIVYNNSYHIGVALSTDKGLLTPVIREVEKKNFAAIEQEIIGFAQKAKDKKLLPQELMGGTFTITNGGVFGNMLSTPIPSPPQSGILGMHAIQKRAVVVDDDIVIRPMMYVALTYDHRIVDGREAIGFLLHLKRQIEDPNRLVLGI